MKEILAKYSVVCALAEGQGVIPCRPTPDSPCPKLNGQPCKEMAYTTQAGSVVLECNVQQKPITIVLPNGK